MGTKFANPYLEAKIQAFDNADKAARDIQARATKAARDLTPAELEQIKTFGEDAAKLGEEIATLSEIETRNAKTRKMAADIAGGGDDADDDADDDTDADAPKTRGVGGAKTRQRDPGHYRSLQAGGKQSFFGDLYRSANGDQDAARRQVEHMRFLDTAGEGTGVIAPKWLTDEYAELPRQGRALASAVRNIPLGDDPRPLTLPKQTSGSDAAVAEQAAEGDPTSDTDGWDSDVDTVIPKPTSGAQIVTRQLLDMSSPSIDLLIYGDLIGAYNDKVELKVCQAIAAVGSSLPSIDNDDVTDITHYNRVAIDAAMQIRQNRKRPPDAYTMSNIRYGKVLGLVDTTGRPLVPDASAGPMNVAGVGSVQTDGRWHGMGIIASAGFPQDDRFWALHLASILLFESNMLRFRYEQPLGPEKVRMGIWAYSAVLVRYGTTAVKRVEIDES